MSYIPPKTVHPIAMKLWGMVGLMPVEVSKLIKLCSDWWHWEKIYTNTYQ